MLLIKVAFLRFLVVFVRITLLLWCQSGRVFIKFRILFLLEFDLQVTDLLFIYIHFVHFQVRE